MDPYIIILSILLPIVCLCVISLCCHFCKTRKIDSYQNNSSQSENHPFQHTRAAVTSSPSSGNTRGFQNLPAFSIHTEENKHHSPLPYVGKKTDSPCYSRDDDTDHYEEPQTLRELVPGSYYSLSESSAYLAPRVPSTEKPQVKSSIRVSWAPTPGRLPPQPPTPGSLPPQLHSPGRTLPQPPTPRRLPPQLPNPGRSLPQPPTPRRFPPQLPNPGRSLPQPPTLAWLPPQSPTSPDFPPQPPFTPKLGSETQLSPAVKLPLPPPSQSLLRPNRHVITNGEGTAKIVIVFPSKQATTRNPPETSQCRRPITQAFLEINKNINIKFKTYAGM
ncbi:uncharacterized protein LOC134764867 [Penaeus indicus]|uniref:uncharacterized protein LOC134764867 n=1 Tax=Penaeus indicus TaxID=29960 RepID=UPI00300CA523